MEERKYRHGDEIITTPLSSLLCASNELPSAADELGALYDRIHLRVQVEPIKDNRNLHKMLVLTDQDMDPIMSWDDVIEAQVQAKAITQSKEALDGLIKLRGALIAEGFSPSDRRIRKVLTLMQASAWLDGRTETIADDLLVCQHTMWDRPEQIADVDKIVTAHASPLAARCATLLADIDRYEVEIAKVTDDDRKIQKAEEIYSKLLRCKKEVNKLHSEVTQSPSRTSAIQQVDARLKAVTGRVLREVYGVDPDQDPDQEGDK
jgi:MoxR-like ATPase